MPTVPIETNRLGIATVSDAKLQAPDLTGTGLEAYGHAFQNLGAGGMELAEGLHEVATRKAAIDAKDGDNRALLAGTQILDDPDTGYRALRGKAAADAYAPTLQRLKDTLTEIRGSLPDKRSQRLFDQASGQRLAAWQSAMAEHAMNATEQYQDDTSDTRIQLNRSAAINAYDQPKIHEQAIGTLASEMQSVGARLQWTPEQIANHTLIEVSGTRTATAVRMAQLSPDAAKAYAQAHPDQILGSDAAKIDEAVRISQDRIDATARRDAAEARAQQAHAISLQREQLGTLKAGLETGAGSSADWETLSSGYKAIGDTSAAVEAHARGVQMAAADKYRGAALPEVDQRISALEGKGALTVNDASELKGLHTLREQTAARLNQPGGALDQFQFATGQQLEPLNTNDPGTFVRRAARAADAARAYGRQTVEPLTGSDVKTLKDLVAGNPQQRLSAITMIAKFHDPAAIEGAARQISEKEDGGFRIASTLINLPGSAGYQAARDVLNGPEAAKTNAGVFLPAAAKVTFQAYAGPALQHLPQDYAADVLDAARNLYISRMTANGHTVWDDQAWRSAIDTALGGYVAGGQRYGGIAQFKGVAVSIPPGWTADGLFRRLARASVTDWRGATVGATPMWPDGSAVTTTEMQQLVPSRLGGTKYGLLTPSGRFLTAKGGGPYVFDAAKVPWR